MKSGPGALPGFKSWRAAANSWWEKLPETFAGCNGSALQRSDTSCKTSRDERRFTPSYFPFLTSCEAIASAETGHWRGDSRDLPVKLFIVFHASRLECEKSMLRTVSDQRFLRFPSSLVSRAVAALSELPAFLRRSAYYLAKTLVNLIDILRFRWRYTLGQFVG